MAEMAVKRMRIRAAMSVVQKQRRVHSAAARDAGLRGETPRVLSGKLSSKYSLSSMVCHTGSHYVSFHRQEGADTTWKLIDDEHVISASLSYEEVVAACRTGNVGTMLVPMERPGYYLRVRGTDARYLTMLVPRLMFYTWQDPRPQLRRNITAFVEFVAGTRVALTALQKARDLFARRVQWLSLAELASASFPGTNLHHAIFLLEQPALAPWKTFASDVAVPIGTFARRAERGAAGGASVESTHHHHPLTHAACRVQASYEPAGHAVPG